MQNHLRTKIGPPQDRQQIEVDELYVGVDKSGNRYIVPVEAKGGTDTLSPLQLRNLFRVCEGNYEGLGPRPIAIQFKSGGGNGKDVIVMFELGMVGSNVMVKEEKHYILIPSEEMGIQR